MLQVSAPLKHMNSWKTLNFLLTSRIPVVTEKTPVVGTRRKRQDNPTEDDLFDFDFSDFDSKFDDIPQPSLDPDFEPSVDLPLGIVYSIEN